MRPWLDLRGHLGQSGRHCLHLWSFPHRALAVRGREKTQRDLTATEELSVSTRYVRLKAPLL